VESDTTTEIPISEPEAATKPKRGWPKGKKRGPKKPKPAEAPTQDAPELPVEAPSDPELAGMRARLRVTEIEALGAQEPPKRRKRAAKTGVTLDGRWFPCQTAEISEDGKFVLRDGEIETLVPVASVKKLEFSGVALGIHFRPVARDSIQPWTGTPGTTVIVPAPVPPSRTVEKFNRNRNRELESLMGSDV
jgi:hypothetical protein